MPPAAPPNSAPVAELETRNSCTISRPIATREPPVVSSRLSTPSIDRLLLRPRMPEKEKPLSAAALRTPASDLCELDPADEAAPGAISTKFKKLRLDAGASSMRSPPSVAAAVVAEDSSASGWPCTSIFSITCAGFISRRCVTVCPSETVNGPTVTGAKPSRSIVSV